MKGGVPETAREARALADTWLAALRRDPAGQPVPWINRWGAEDPAHTRVIVDPLVGGPAVFHDDHGDVPDFTRQNLGRQRQAMIEGRCQVCGRATPWSRRNIVLSGVTCETVRLGATRGGGRPFTAVYEPWLDDRCAAIARLLCPALIRRAHDEDFHLHPIRSAKEVRYTAAYGRLEIGGAGPADRERLAPWTGEGAPLIALTVKLALMRLQVVMRDRDAPTPEGAGSGAG